MALGCTLPPVWLVPTGVYLIKFLIRNLSYSPCSEPSRTVLFPNVTYTLHNVRPPPVLTRVTPLYRSILLFLHGVNCLSVLRARIPRFCLYVLSSYHILIMFCLYKVRIPALSRSRVLVCQRAPAPAYQILLRVPKFVYSVKRKVAK